VAARPFAASGLAGAVLLAAVAGLALAAPWLWPGDPFDIVARPLLPAFADPALPLGTDQLGRDVAAGLAHGARVSIVIGCVAAATTLLIGVAVGTLAGFLGGWTDEAAMRVAEAVQTVPAFLLALVVVSVLGPSAANVVLAIAIASWPAPARLVRAEILSLRGRAFVEAARAIGLTELRIAFAEVLPNALAPVVALAGIMVASAILVESALSFLGLGDPNLLSWGGMVASGRGVLRTAPILVAAPGIAIAATVLAVTLVSDAVADRLALHRTAA
jgi:peptide/nickel transport system permease protein